MNLIKPSFSTGYAKNASESANPNLWKGLVGAWMPSFGDSGKSLQDISGRSNDAELLGRTSIPEVTIRRGVKSILMDGNSDAYRVNNVGDFSPKHLSFCAWVSDYGSVAGSKDIGGVWRSGKRSWLLRNVNGYPKFYTSPDGSAINVNSTSDLIPFPEFTNICCVHDGTTAKIFQDGKLTASYSAPYDLFDSQTEMCIAAILFNDRNSPLSGFTWNGFISQQLFYNRALSPTEIKQLYRNPAAPFQKKTKTVVSIPVAPVTTTAKAVVIKKPKPSYATGYARNASESANPNLWKGLVGAWMPSFGVTGETLRDVSGNGNDGTLQFMDAATDWVATSKGLALDFDGVNDRVIFTSSGFAFGTGDFSIEGWAYVTSHKAWRALATTRPNTAGLANAWHIGCGAAADIFLYSNTFNLRSAAGAVPVNTWFHWCCVRINSVASLLVNTAVVDSGTVTNNYTKTLLGIGDFPQASAEPWSGHMSAFKVYNRALSPSEIKQLYLNPAAPFLRKQQTVGISTAQAFNPYWANQATQLAGTLQ